MASRHHRKILLGGAPAISVTGDTNFGSTPVGTPVSEVFTIENTGTRTLVITLPITTPAGFTVTVDPAASIAPGASTTFTVRADAGSVAVFSGNISITSNAAGSPTLVPITATIEAIYLLKSSFASATPAPVGSPLALEVGSLTVVDTGNKVSISGGKLLGSGSTVNLSDWRLEDAAGLRVTVPGRTLKIKSKGNAVFFGFDNDGSGNLGDSRGAARFSALLWGTERGSQINRAAMTTATEYTYWLIHRYFGYFLIVEGGVYSTPTLVYVGGSETDARHRFMITNNGNLAMEFDDLELLDYGGDYGLSTLYALENQNFPALGVGVAEADIFLTIIFTIQTGDTNEVSVRYTDDNNRILARYVLATNTLSIVKVEAGVESVLVSNTLGGGTPTNNTIMRWAIQTIGTDIFVGLRDVVGSPSRWIRTTDSFNQAVTGYKLAGMITLRYLEIFPSLVTPPSVQSADSPLFIWAVGDSKTALENYYPAVTGYTYYASKWLEANLERGAYPRPTPVGHSTFTTLQLKNIIDADLAATVGTPDFVILNIGVNDALGAMPLQAAFETNYAYILDAIHTKWASAPVLVAKPGCRGQAADCTTIAGWIDNVIASRAWASVGADEQIILEGGDDYTTRTTDGTHQNALGNQAMGEAYAAAYVALL